MDNTELLEKMDQIILLLKNRQFAYQKPPKKTTQKKKTNKKGDNAMQRGSITYRNDGRWMGRCYDENGKQKCVYAKSKKECSEKLRLLIDEVERKKHSPQAHESMTIMEFFEIWFKTYREPSLKESTAIQTKNQMQRYLKSIGHLKIKNISIELLQTTVNSVNSKDIRKVVYSNLYGMYEKLFFTGAIPQNIMGMVVLAKEKNAMENMDEVIKKEKKQILQLGEENSFVYKKNEIKFKNFIEFAINTGMRPGEILGLQKKDLDFEKKTISVNKQMNSTTKKLSSPKSKKGNRIIPMFKKTEDILKSMNVLLFEDEEFIFKLKYPTICEFLSRLCERQNKTLTCKTFRKTFSSRCQNIYGIDKKQVQNWLGHEKYDTTDIHYTFITDKETINNIKKYNECSDTHTDTSL